MYHIKYIICSKTITHCIRMLAGIDSIRYDKYLKYKIQEHKKGAWKAANKPK